MSLKSSTRNQEFKVQIEASLRSPLLEREKKKKVERLAEKHFWSFNFKLFLPPSTTYLLHQCFMSFIVQTNHLGILLKNRFGWDRSDQRSYISNKFQSKSVGRTVDNTDKQSPTSPSMFCCLPFPPCGLYVLLHFTF